MRNKVVLVIFDDVYIYVDKVEDEVWLGENIIVE